MFATRLDDLPDGRLQLIVTGYYGPGKTAYGMNWADSAWVTTWSGIHENYIMWPTSSPRAARMLVWKTTVPTTTRASHLVTATAYGDSVSVADTVAVCDVEAFLYTGAVQDGTRWVAVQDLDTSTLGFPYHLRIYRSDLRSAWRRVHDERIGTAPLRGLTIQPIAPQGLLVVRAVFNGYIQSGTLSDSIWTPGPTISGFGIVSGPQFRDTPRGGQWLAWADSDSTILIDRHLDGAWVEPDTIHSVRDDRLQWGFYQPYLSKDTGAYPAVAWHGFSSPGLIDHVWVAFPTDSGFGLGEKLAGTAFGYLPQVARDEHGDVWVAFSRDLAGAFWLHTYVHATTTVPRVVEHDGRPLVKWTLTEPAPETWWAVERAVGAGEFETAGRLRANGASDMQWRDDSAPAREALRYRIRRESKDARYRWWSAETVWEPRGPSLRLTRVGSHPAESAIEIEVGGAAAGRITVRLHDLQGRQVFVRDFPSAGTAHDVLRLPITDTTMPSGIYLLRANDSTGRRSRGLKIAILR